MIGGVLKGAWRGALQAFSDGNHWQTLSGASEMPSTSKMSYAGKSVSADKAMKLSAAWACVKSNSQLIGSLPLAVYEKQADGSKVKIEPDLLQILRVSPNTNQTGMEYWEGMTSQQLLQGNAYAQKMFIGRNMVGLRPLMLCEPRLRDDGQFDYHVTENGKTYKLPPDQIFHLRGFGAGTGLGMSAIKYGVESLGSALAADETAARIFSNGLMAGGFIKADQTLDETQRGQLQALIEKFVSSKRAGKVMALEGGLSFEPSGINPEDAQLLETRRFQVEDVCRWFGTPPIIIGHAAAGQTMWGSGVEAIMLAWRTLGINPQLVRMEARISKDLIPIARRAKWSVEWNREAMMQMDSAAKSNYLTRLTTTGIMTADESRHKLMLPPRGGAADELHAQTALAPLEDLGKEKAA